MQAHDGDEQEVCDEAARKELKCKSRGDKRYRQGRGEARTAAHEGRPHAGSGIQYDEQGDKQPEAIRLLAAEDVAADDHRARNKLVYQKQEQLVVGKPEGIAGADRKHHACMGEYAHHQGLCLTLDEKCGGHPHQNQRVGGDFMQGIEIEIGNLDGDEKCTATATEQSDGKAVVMAVVEKVTHRTQTRTDGKHQHDLNGIGEIRHHEKAEEYQAQKDQGRGDETEDVFTEETLHRACARSLHRFE
ncbi:MAG TPA: hypothetical protein DEB24_00745, partial [Coriobacteriia bacterium]|nr:hypothetical protein [Coriobacteriia bacterium]